MPFLKETIPLILDFPQTPLNRGYHPYCGKESPLAFFPVTPLGKILSPNPKLIPGPIFYALLPLIHLRDKTDWV